MYQSPKYKTVNDKIESKHERKYLQLELVEVDMESNHVPQVN